MATLRDLVRFEPSQRVDLPDFRTVQRNSRSDTRSHLLHLLFGSDVAKVMGGFGVTAAGVPDATVTVTAGRAFGSEILEDASSEFGVAFGLEGDPSQVLDFTGQPIATYGIWLRFTHTQGEQGNRVFWNGTTASEETSTIDTRLVVGWDSTISLASPGAEYVQIAEVVWDGATVDPVQITMKRPLFFEGEENGALYPHVWGDGINDRDSDRGSFGIGDLYTWVHAVRRQIDDIIGETGWWKAPDADLAETRVHLDLTTDAHSSSPSWTGTVTAASADLGGSGTGTVEINTALDQFIIHDVPVWGSVVLGNAKWSFFDLKWNVNESGGALIRWGSSATEYEYVYYAAANPNGPDLVLSITDLVRQARSFGTEIATMAVYWNQQNAAAVANAANRIQYEIKMRDFNEPEGNWTVHASGTINGGDEIDPANAPNIALLAFAAFTPASGEEWILVLNSQGTVDGFGPLIYGGLVVYSPDKLYPA